MEAFWEGARNVKLVLSTPSLFLYLGINVVAAFASRYFEPSLKGLAKLIVYVSELFFCSLLWRIRPGGDLLFVDRRMWLVDCIAAVYGLYQYKIGVAPLATWEDPECRDTSDSNLFNSR